MELLNSITASTSGGSGQLGLETRSSWSQCYPFCNSDIPTCTSQSAITQSYTIQTNHQNNANKVTYHSYLISVNYNATSANYCNTITYFRA